MNKKFTIKQQNIGTWWGTLKLLYQHVGMYFTAANMLISLSTLYIVSTQYDINLIIPAIIVSVVLVCMGVIMEWKYSMPSWYAANNKQAWEHGSPIKAKLEDQDKEIGAVKDYIKRRFDQLEDSLDLKIY